MAIPIIANTISLESLKMKAQNLPDRNSGGGSVDVSGVDATDSDVRDGKIYYGLNGKSAGTAPVFNVPSLITPGVANATYNTNGKYMNGDIVIAGDSNLISTNIKNGVSIFGVTGHYTGSGSGGVNTSDATAVSEDVRNGKTFYNANGKQTGSMPDASIEGGAVVYESGVSANIVASVSEAGYIESGAHTIGSITIHPGASITPSAAQRVEYTKNRYVLDDIVVDGDSNLVSDNIKNGVSIFGVNGSYKGSSLSETINYNAHTDKITINASTIDTVIIRSSSMYAESSYKKCNITELIYSGKSDSYIARAYNTSLVGGLQSAVGYTAISGIGTADILILNNEDGTISISGEILLSYTDSEGALTTDYFPIEFKGIYEVFLIKA